MTLQFQDPRQAFLALLREAGIDRFEHWLRQDPGWYHRRLLKLNREARFVPRKLITRHVVAQLVDLAHSRCSGSILSTDFELPGREDFPFWGSDEDGQEDEDVQEEESSAGSDEVPV